MLKKNLALFSDDIQLQALREFLLDNFKANLDNKAFLTTGSDGRGEFNRQVREIEILVVCKSSEGLNHFKEIFEREITQNYSGIKLDMDFEYRSFDDGYSFGVFNHAKGSLVIPTRVLDAIQIAGNETIFKDYQKTYLNDILEGELSIGAFNKGPLKSARRNYREFNKKAIGDHITSGDLKHSMCRTIQYSVAKKILDWLKVNHRADDFDEAWQNFETIPKSVGDRIMRLQDKEVLNATVADRLKKLYEAITIEHHFREVVDDRKYNNRQDFTHITNWLNDKIKELETLLKLF